MWEYSGDDEKKQYERLSSDDKQRHDSESEQYSMAAEQRSVRAIVAGCLRNNKRQCA